MPHHGQDCPVWRRDNPACVKGVPRGQALGANKFFMSPRLDGRNLAIRGVHRVGLTITIGTPVTISGAVGDFVQLLPVTGAM